MYGDLYSKLKFRDLLQMVDFLIAGHIWISHKCNGECINKFKKTVEIFKHFLLLAIQQTK